MMLRHEAPRDAAGISYFTLMALFPMILIVIAVTDYFLGWLNLHDTVVRNVVELFPGSNQFVQSTLEEIITPSRTAIFSCVAVVLWVASWVFTFIEGAINRAWDIPNQRTFWDSRLRTVALLALCSISLLISSLFTVFLSTARRQAMAHIDVSTDFMGWFWYLAMLGAGMLIAVFVFTLIYKWTPYCKVFWSEALAGAVTATVVWEIAGYIFMKLVPMFDYQQVYGKMGTIIALLVWLYTSNMILIFGAHFCAQLHWARFELPGHGLLSEKIKSSGEHLSK